MALKTLFIAVNTINHVFRSFPLFAGLTGLTPNSLVDILDAPCRDTARGLLPRISEAICPTCCLSGPLTTTALGLGTSQVMPPPARQKNDPDANTDIQDKLFALLRRTVADAVDFKLFFIALGHADDHIVRSERVRPWSALCSFFHRRGA